MAPGGLWTRSRQGAPLSDAVPTVPNGVDPGRRPRATHPAAARRPRPGVPSLVPPRPPPRRPAPTTCSTRAVRPTSRWSTATRGSGPTRTRGPTPWCSASCSAVDSTTVWLEASSEEGRSAPPPGQRGVGPPTGGRHDRPPGRALTPRPPSPQPPMTIYTWPSPYAMLAATIDPLLGEEASMTTTRMRCWLMALVALVVALSMTWSTATPARAGRPYDLVPAARHRVLGQHLTNHHTHMETWIVGWFSYPPPRPHPPPLAERRRSTASGSPPSTARPTAAGVPSSPGSCGRPTSPAARSATVTRGSRARRRAGRPVHPGHHRVRCSVELVRGLRRPSAAHPRPPLRGPLRRGIVGGWRSRPVQEPLGAHPLRGWRDHGCAGSLGLRGSARRGARSAGRLHDRRRGEGLPHRARVCSTT